MTQRPSFPESVAQIAPEQAFCFSCHPGLVCFTECCRMLELPLTPYDVLRLRHATGLSSQQLHDQYIIEEQEKEDIFPRYYLTMIDDGRASCVFVDPEKGCQVYPHRPGACRAYPLGRAAIRHSNGSIEEHHVQIKESHCHGFLEKKSQTVVEYYHEQGLEDYNRFNDALIPLTQHENIRNGSFIPTTRQQQLYRLVLYNIDTFRAILKKETAGLPNCPPDVINNDERLLLFGINLLINRFFRFENNEKS